MTKSMLFIWILLGVNCACSVSCNNNETAKEVTTPKNITQFRILINSPYGCYNDILLDSMGSGIDIFGFRPSPQATGKDTIVRKKQFIIRTDNDKAKIWQTITDIESRKAIKSSLGNDSYHFTLTINDQKLIDISGEDSLTTRILMVLSPYIQNNDSIECDYFTLLKRAQKKS